MASFKDQSAATSKSTLPDNPNLGHLKGQAKALLKLAKNADREALARFTPYFSTATSFGLQDAQLVIAREYGFASWQALKSRIEADPPNSPAQIDSVAQEFLHLAVVTYSEVDPADPARWNKAKSLLESNPGIRGHSIYTAAAIGDVEWARHWLDEQPGLLNAKGGFFDWQPLMYAAYSRLPGASTLDVAKLLIERGADPNAFYLSGGTYRFTALTGVFGEGESGPIRQPEHPDCVAFARLLLDAGAYPHDSQAAYNRMFRKDDTCMELLLEYGLNNKDKNNWQVDGQGQTRNDANNTLHYQLVFALRNGMPKRAKLLIDHGADVNTPADGRTPHHWALLNDEHDAADYLVQHGATPHELSETDRLRGACLSADRALAENMLVRNPALLDDIRTAHPTLLHEAASADNRKAATLMCDLGLDVNRLERVTPLHEAAMAGHLHMVKLLIDKGADARLRDTSHFGPPINWAEYCGKDDVARFLEECDMDVCAAAARGKVALLKKILDADPDALNQRFSTLRPPKDVVCERDWMTPLAFAVMNDQIDSVELLLGRGANASLTDDDGKTLVDIAREFAGEQVQAQVIAAARRLLA